MFRILSVMCHCQNYTEMNKTVRHEVLSVVLLKIEVFWNRGVKSDPVCMISCIQDLLFCFLYSSAGVLYVSATVLAYSGLLLFNCKCQLILAHFLKLMQDIAVVI